MKRMLIYLMLAMSLCVVAVSCGKNQLNGKWMVESLKSDSGELIYPAESGEQQTFSELSIEIANLKYSASAGVNVINGEMKVKGSKISFMDGPMTRMSADPYSMQVENAFLKALSTVDNYSIEDGKLLLKDTSANILFVLTK